MIKRLTLIGVGLIGGSLALALKKSGFCVEVVGYARNEKNLRYAVGAGVLDRYETTIAAAVIGADIVVLAVPLGATSEVLQEIHRAAKTDAIITDVGSAKASVIDAARRMMPERLPYFVPGHPIAGKEHSGVDHAEAELFQDHFTILTPMAETLSTSQALIARMWQQAGAKVVSMDIEYHDQVLAATSHLPHMLAYLLVDTLAKMEEKGEIFKYAAGGFYDFTRIASSNPEMWRDICLNNSQAIVAMLRRYQSAMGSLVDRLEADDGQGLFELFSRSKLRRDQLISEKNTETTE